MSCDHIIDLLYDYAKNRLDIAERSTVEAHLSSCPDCKENLRLLQKSLPVLDEWQPPELPPAMAERLSQSAQRLQIPWWKRILKQITLPSQFMLPLQAVAVASIAMVFIAGIGTKNQGVNSIGSRGGLTITMPDIEVTDPILIRAKSVQGGLEELRELIEKYGGQLRRHKNVTMVVGFSIDADKESLLLEEVAREIGTVDKPKSGYRAQDGTLVLVIMEQ